MSYYPSNFSWTYICPTGIEPWMPKEKMLNPCFQEICLQFPVLILFTLMSAYHFGNQTNRMRRNKLQISMIYIRIMVSFLLAVLPLYELFLMIRNSVQILPIDVLINCVQIFSWMIHCGFLLSLRTHGTFTHRGPVSVIILWVFVLLCSILWMRSNKNTEKNDISKIAFGLLIGYLATLILSGRASNVIRRNATDNEETRSLLHSTYVRFQDDAHVMVLGRAQDEAPFLSRFLFYWVNPLIEKGCIGRLQRIDDLFELPESLNILNITEKVQCVTEKTQSLLTILRRVFGVEFFTIGLLRFISDTSGFAGPLLLAALLKHETANEIDFDYLPYLYALGLFGVTLISAFCGTHFNWRMSLISMKMRIGITTLIYKKTLNAQFVNSDSPEILNLMSTDTDRIVNSCISFHSFWSIPFQLFTTLYLLYTQIGIAFAAGLVFAIILIPINRLLAKRIASYSQDVLQAKDSRVALIFEALSGIKQIKILAWEDIFLDKIHKLRTSEINSIAKRKYLDAMCVYFWAATPIIINLLTFGAATFLGIKMTAANTFVSVALLNMLIGPLNAFPWILNGLVEAWVSLRRMQKYFNLTDVDFNNFYSPLEVDETQKTEPEQSRKPIVLSIRNASFAYDRTRQLMDENNDEYDCVLKSVNCDIKMTNLVCLEGPCGGGKSALLHAIAGNLTRMSGYVHIQDAESGFGFVSQTIWLQHGTIRENIIWGEVFDVERYKKILLSCALLKDIEDLGGDEYDVGEGGASLSGGQRARIALARAIYQNKDIILIDDILNSLDAHVANHIVKHCILGLLKDKTRIIVTENRTLFYYANQIVRVENGVTTPSDFALGSFESEFEDSEEDVSPTLSFDLTENVDHQLNRLSTQETKETGTISVSVLSIYWKAWGSWIACLVIVSIILMQASKNISDAWLAHWIKSIKPSNNTHRSSNSKLLGTRFYTDSIVSNVICLLNNFLLFENTDQCKTTQYGSFKESYLLSLNLVIYIIIAIFNSIFTLLRAFSFAYAGIKAAKFMHSKLLNSVFYSEFTFFDITPVGRILNRFSSDTYTIDDSLPFILNILLAQFVGLIGAFCINIYAMPWLLLLIVPMSIFYFNIQSRYRSSSRDIKRLSSNLMSPIYTQFTETINGLSTIRAMRANNRFCRDFFAKLEDSICAQLTQSAAQQWLGLRLQLLGAIFVGGSAFVAVFTSANSSSPELVGLAISYSLSITGMLTGVLNALTETEQEFVAVERVHNYCKLRPEANADGTQDPPFGWPVHGVVKFDNVMMKYRDYLQPSLKGMSFQVSPCERIGIVGRTGAGKSSIIAALLRTVPIQYGRITVDSIDVSTLPVQILRNRISLVPQDSFLFSGTIRENMDPRKLHLDSNIWDAMNRCLVTPLVQNLGGLGAQLDSRGSNISAGQKQLLCLARALLSNSKVVIIDEGTSSLDSDSENAIQIVLRNAFKSSTVLLIAHRLNGLQQTDRILVIENGTILEEGKPQQLADDPDSRFSLMLNEQQTKRTSNF